MRSHWPACLALPFPSALRFAGQRIQDKQTDMAPSNISPGSAATVLSFVILAGLQLETRFRVGEVLAAPQLSSDEPEPELPLGQRQLARPARRF